MHLQGLLRFGQNELIFNLVAGICKKSDDGVDITIIKSLLKNDLCNINAKLDLLYIGHQGSKSDKIKKDSSGAKPLAKKLVILINLRF